MNLRAFIAAAAILLSLTTRLQAQDTVALTDTEVGSLCKSVTRSTVSVHDPSVVQLTADSKTFYIAGTMRGWARSTDNMRNWNGLDNSSLFGTVSSQGAVVATDYHNCFSNNVTKKVKALVNGEVTEVDFGNYDAAGWSHADQENWNLDGNMWAPDILYNPYSGKWMMYQSINGDDWHSCIVLLTADKITGPYVYQGPVHFSGFINNTNPVISFKKTDLELVIGEQTTLPERYNKGNNWGTYWTNDIDPCVFFDEEGELWMTYGSWSGGIFILKMDKQTGLRDYTVTYPIENDGEGRALYDPYFGKRIAGGYYSSGEGSYIQHIGDYYYLFLSYGFYAPDGGYEMRTFRSSTPDGQYVDAGNLDACFHNRAWQTVGPRAETNGGMKLMAAYNEWGLQTVGECAQGHNSVTADAAGRHFVVYHTKFNNGTDGHQVRTRQLFLNRHGWLCAAPFQFDGETATSASIAAANTFTAADLAGSYKLLIHKYKMDYENMEEVKPINITLSAAGKITGARSGTWALVSGTDYITLTINNVVYEGVVVKQTVDGTDIPAIGITATAEQGGSCGVQIWAYHIDPRYAVAYTAQQNTITVKDGDVVRQNLTLPTTGYLGAKVTWASSDATAITAKGVYKKPTADTPVTLTYTVTCENVSYIRTINVTAANAEELPDGDYLTDCVAHYPFTSTTAANQLDKTQKPAFKKLGSGTAPVIERDASLSKNVLHQYFGTSDNASYTLMNNPLNGLSRLSGVTIALWVKMNSDNAWDAIWGFTNNEAAAATSRFFMTGNCYVGFNNGSGTWFDINKPDNGNTTGYLPTGSWAFVVVVMNTSSVAVYVDGVKKANKSAAGSGYGTALAALRSMPYMQLGTGSFWGSADCNIRDLLVYKRALSAKDVALLTIMAGRAGTDYTAISSPAAERILPTDGTWHDLSGRRIDRRQVRRGLYIVNGRKVLIK